ncbi:hypothetical protein PQX77_016058 [Marasmius sp. AFHP31]|nr:hypothetical protein PQX77_016058 [Marasmius sp. AFHP31]
METVDDTDLSRLIYSNSGKGWRKRENDKLEYLSTSHGSPAAGSSVTFRFNGMLPLYLHQTFRLSLSLMANLGTSVEVKGTVLKQNQGTDNSQKPLALFVLDLTSKITYTGKLSNDTLHDERFYFNSSLPANVEHSLTMTLVDPDSLLWLDYINYAPVMAAAPDASSTSSSTATDVATATKQSQSNADTSNGVSKGLVAGVSVLAAILTASIVLGLVWWLQRRKRRKQGSEETQNVSYTHPSDPTSPIQSEFRQGHVRPYPTSINPPGSLGKPQIPSHHVVNQYSSAGSGSGHDRGQPQEDAPPYRKRG